MRNQNEQQIIQSNVPFYDNYDNYDELCSKIY